MDALEQQKIFEEGQTLADFTQEKAWGLIKGMLTDSILDLQSVMNIKHTGPTDMAREVYARQLAVDTLFEVIKKVEGRAQQHVANQSLMGDPIIQQI